jgi:hypothetical protein
MSEQTAPNLQAQPGTLTARVQITRAATGKVEEYDLVFTPVAEEPPQDKEAE